MTFSTIAAAVDALASLKNDRWPFFDCWSNEYWSWLNDNCRLNENRLLNHNGWLMSDNGCRLVRNDGRRNSSTDMCLLHFIDDQLANSILVKSNDL